MPEIGDARIAGRHTFVEELLQSAYPRNPLPYALVCYQSVNRGQRTKYFKTALNTIDKYQKPTPLLHTSRYYEETLLALFRKTLVNNLGYSR